MHGIRYLDIRVGYYSSSASGGERFWVNHNFYRMRPLSSLINDVRKFAEETREIVILDFHRFPVGFDGRRDRHAQLVEYVNGELERFTVPSSFWPNATPNEIWAANKSIIISYSDTRTAQQYPNLWPPLPQVSDTVGLGPNWNLIEIDPFPARTGMGRQTESTRAQVLPE